MLSLTVYDENGSFWEEINYKSKKLLFINDRFFYKYQPPTYGRGARGVMVIDTATRFQILDQADCISHSTKTLGKGMNIIILLQLWVNSRVDWVLQPWWGN